MSRLPPPVADPRYTTWRCGMCLRMWTGGDGRHTCWTFRAVVLVMVVVTAGELVLMIAMLRG